MVEEVWQTRNGQAMQNLTFENFLNCPGNLALNRQSRMLSNLSIFNYCKNQTSHSYKNVQNQMLQSAKRNLIQMDYFGLTEFQQQSQILFERVFDVEFKKNFTVSEKVGFVKYKGITSEHLQMTKKLNHLDVELYEFAKQLFMSRLKHFKNTSYA